MPERWVDKQGDVWTPGEDGLLHSPETAPFPREHVERKWGPLKPVPDGLKLREGDQPLPTVNDRQDIQSMVIADITARRQVGIQRYGTALQAHNGRDMLRDAYEEALDLAIYLRGVIEERDRPA